MAATMQSYTYKPLPSKRHIRVTEIQPGTVDSPLSITLREVCFLQVGSSSAMKSIKRCHMSGETDRAIYH